MPITELHKEVSNGLRQLCPVNGSELALSLQVERLNLRNLPKVSAGFLERCQAAPDSQCGLHSELSENSTRWMWTTGAFTCRSRFTRPKTSRRKSL